MKISFTEKILVVDKDDLKLGIMGLGNKGSINFAIKVGETFI